MTKDSKRIELVYVLGLPIINLSTKYPMLTLPSIIWQMTHPWPVYTHPDGD